MTLCVDVFSGRTHTVPAGERCDWSRDNDPRPPAPGGPSLWPGQTGYFTDWYTQPFAQIGQGPYVARSDPFPFLFMAGAAVLFWFAWR